MEYVSADMNANIGALELSECLAAIELPGDIELELSVFMGPPPTQSIQCPTIICNITKSGCR